VRSSDGSENIAVKPDYLRVIWQSALASVSSSLLVLQMSSTGFAQDLHEFDGTLVRHGHGFATVVDGQCHYHSYEAPAVGIIIDGVLSKNYLKPPIAAHFVVGPSTTGETIISITRKAAGGPRNCSVYSNERSVTGFLTEISQGNAAGSISLESDTGSTLDFSYESGLPARRIRFNGKPFMGCTNWPPMPCSSMQGLSPRMRVRVRYNVQMVDGKRIVNLLAVDRIEEH
jgi:hypothetical protein